MDVLNNSIRGSGEKSEEMAGSFKIKVTHGLNQHEVAVPSNSSFGDLKSVIVQKIGLKPEMHKLLFRGKEKDDDEGLQPAGVKDNSKVLLVEDLSCTEKSPDYNETRVISRGGAAVAEVTEEVDKLSEKVSALQAAVNSGTKVDSKDIIYVTEMLMRQLLKLDSIEAEGEGKVQRKMEVRRIQSLVETVDVLKSKNLNPFNNVDSNVAVATQWETFEPDWGSTTTTSSVISFSPNPQPSSTPDPTLTPTSIVTTSTLTAIPSSAPNLAQSSVTTPNPKQFSAPFVASPIITTSTPTAIPSSVPNLAPSSVPTPNSKQFSTPFIASPIHSSAFSSPTVHSPSPSPTKMQCFAPMPSSTKVTEDWVHFD